MELLKEYLKPENLPILFAFVVGVLLPTVARILRALGRTEAAETLEEAQARAEAAEAGFASVVQGAQDLKGLLAPRTAKVVVDTLRRRNVKNGVEHLVRPIVEATATGVPPIEAVKAQTRKYRKVEG